MHTRRPRISCTLIAKHDSNMHTRRCIRAGLVYHAHSWLDPLKIQQSERHMAERLMSAWSSHERIHILGGTDIRGGRVGIISFNLLYGNSNVDGCGLYLHYNFVCALLNDLFGVQARGGCACAGEYCVCV